MLKPSPKVNISRITMLKHHGVTICVLNLESYPEKTLPKAQRRKMTKVSRSPPQVWNRIAVLLASTLLFILRWVSRRANLTCPLYLFNGEAYSQTDTTSITYTKTRS